MAVIILHLDDDPMMHMKTEISLQENPFGLAIEYHMVSTPEEFMNAFDLLRPDCVLLDILLGDNEPHGLDLLREIRKQGYEGAAVMLTSVAEPQIIAHSVEAGANDFVTKGMSEVELAYRISHVLNTRAQPALDEVDTTFSGWTMGNIQSRIPKIVKSTLTSMLVWGESGTGKEITAKLFQAYLGSKVPFVSVNCGAFASNLIESEFFGHVKGAYTGATNSRIGIFQQANNGWVFLDEVANLSLAGQSALLRVLETGECRPVGSNRTDHVNVRILAATNVDLDQKVLDGSFRGDLLQRLKTYEIYLPPLRERSRTEVNDLIDHLMGRLNKLKKKVCANADEIIMTPEVRKVFLEYEWGKGNIREMWNAIQACAVEAEEGLLTVFHLPKSIRLSCMGNLEVGQPVNQDLGDIGKKRILGEQLPMVDAGHPVMDVVQTALGNDMPLNHVLAEVEKAVLEASLKRHDRRSDVYAALGISRSSLNQKKQKYQL